MGRLLQLANPKSATVAAALGRSGQTSGCRVCGTHRYRLISVIMLIVSMFALASCGGNKSKVDPTQSGKNTVAIETPSDDDYATTRVSDRPTLSAQELTQFAEITHTVGPTATAAAGSSQVLAISTISEHTCIPEGDKAGVMNLDQYLNNFECIVSYYPWPMDRRVDMDAYRNYFSKDPVGFGPGYQYAGMNTFNTCAWYETWLDANQAGNDQRAARALDIMINIIPNYSEVIPGYPVDDLGTGENDLTRAESAALGDPRQIQDYVNSQCGWLPEWQGP